MKNIFCLQGNPQRRNAKGGFLCETRQKRENDILTI